jgi:ATP-dependent Clp protease ATP-binding subunit ClpC
MNGYNFTERVRKVLQMAREEAQRLHHEYVGTEHILLGLVREGEGVAAAALEAFRINPHEVIEKIEASVRRGKSPPEGPDLPYTSRAKKVLELSMTEARNLRHSYVGTEHLLLGLLREEKGIGAQVLTSFGATADTVREEILRLLGSPELKINNETVQVPPDNETAARSITVLIEHKDGRIVGQRFRTAREAVLYLTHQRES